MKTATMKTIKVWMATLTVFLVHVGISPAQSTNVLRLPATQMNPNYQDWFGHFDWASPTNFTDGSYADNWYTDGRVGHISYRLDRLYDLATFKYGDNTSPDGGRVASFGIAAGSGPVLSNADTSVVLGGVVTPMTGSIGRRGGYILWEAISYTGGQSQGGGSEFEVWGTPTLYRRIPNPSIYTNYQAYSTNYAVTKVFDDLLVRTGGADGEYASGGGLNTYITFDFGIPTTVSAVEIWDRGDGVSGITGARLIFSNDLTFGDAGDITVNYTKAATDPATVVDLIAQGYPNGVARRYVKWQITGWGGAGSVGMAEIGFYATPPGGTVIQIH